MVFALLFQEMLFIKRNKIFSFRFQGCGKDGGILGVNKAGRALAEFRNAA